ncbi:MAG: ATP-dependent helicase HrpB [Proteobacteria bacterium]|nr:ATP-dependent helicase HrpB [Pseudomonadota bacterium]
MNILPIDDHISEIIGSGKRNIVVTATPGSGKTTRIPPALAEHVSGRVLCVEPRRLACIGAAARIAEERGEKLGTFVGYHVRLEKKCTSETRLCFVTTGMLLQYLCSDPFLEGVSAVIFDEFHERSIDNDISFAMVRYLQREVRDDLRVFVMSATLDASDVSSYLGACDVFEVNAPLYPLEVRYAQAAYGMRFSEYGAALVEICGTALAETSGDVLVFLPGVADIQSAISLSEARWGDAYDYVACHASLSIEAQRGILVKSGARRRLIFSTNVAESSVTVPGVSAVVDSGLAKRKFFDSVSGLSRLETVHISRASADQRAGRAARLGPGKCFRLWTEFAHNQFEAQTVPEIERLDLSQAYLQIIGWGLEAPESLPLMSQPAPGRLSDARELLERLGALEAGSLSALGREMVHLPLEPRLARWLLAASENNCLREAALLAAYLSEAPYRRAMRDRFPGPDLYEDYVALKKSIRQPEFSYIRRVSTDILEAARGLERMELPSGGDASDTLKGRLARAMLLAYPDRLAQPRPAKERIRLAETDPRRNLLPISAKMSGNRGVLVREAHSLKDAKFFICADVDLVRGVERAASTVVKAFPVEPAWIPWREDTVARYEPDKDRVVIADAVHFDIFTLRETFLHDSAYEPLRRKTLLEAARRAPQKALNFSSDAWQQFSARLRFAQSVAPDAAFPAFDVAWGLGVLERLCKRAENFEALHAIDLVPLAMSDLDYGQLAMLKRLAPETVVLENGFETAVDYTESPPVIRVKIQKAFGTYRLPRVGGGKVVVMMHLCAPNGRAAQVTQDMESFWRTTYSDVRRQLRGRYPKHDWPETPPGPAGSRA